ncbi:MAG: hypothetical protein Aurels2KO_34800 [Aureliella sp.]
MIIALRCIVMISVFSASSVIAQELTPNVPYQTGGHERQVLDIYTPKEASTRPLPVVFWIHGGGWQTGDKANVELKPRFFTQRGFVFVSTNYRLLQSVSMEELVLDIATSLSWVHRNIATHGGDRNRIIVAGHSAGAQLAALMCTDHRFLRDRGVSPKCLIGCIPVDGDTYDIPKVILSAEFNQALYGGPPITFGHRQKFGNDPRKHISFSPVTHVQADTGIPPFLILYFSGNPQTVAQAKLLERVLGDADVPVKALGKRDTNHRRLNNELGLQGDPATEAVVEFLDGLIGPDK